MPEKVTPTERIFPIEKVRLEAVRERANEKIPTAQERQTTTKKEQSIATQEAIPRHEYSLAEHNTNIIDTPPATQTQRKKAYKQTLGIIRTQMQPTEKLISKTIHSPGIEQFSEAVSFTVARPTSLLFGSIFALFGTILLYAYARFAGFPLSGSETLLIFALGWVMGIIFDWLRTLMRKNK